MKKILLPLLISANCLAQTDSVNFSYSRAENDSALLYSYSLNVKYYDLKGRLVQPGFFDEVTMGFCGWFIMDDGRKKKKVWIDTRK